MSSDTDEKKDVFKGQDLGLLLWLTLFGFGGGMLSLYYAAIGYFPDIKWEEALTYLGVMTIAGVFILILYGLLLLLPGWIWSKYLIYEEHLKDVLCYPEKSEKSRPSPCTRSTLLHIAAPFFVFMVAVHLLFWVESPIVFVLATTGCVILVCIYVWLDLGHALHKSHSRCTKRERFRYVSVFALSLILSLLSLSIIRWGSEMRSNGALAVTCTIIVAVTNLVIAIIYRDQPRHGVLLAVIAALSLLVLGNFLVPRKEEKFSAHIMNAFGIGFDHQVTLLVRDDARPILQGLGVVFTEESVLTQDAAKVEDPTKVEDPKKVENPKKVVILKVQGVEILSRLGPEYFLRFQRRLSFPLSKEKVISWVSEEPKL